MRIGLLAIIIVILAGVMPACSSAAIDCVAACAKTADCNAGTDVAECQKICENTNRISNSGYLTALGQCTDEACDQLGSCAKAARLGCNGDANAFIDEYCAKVNSCSSQFTIAECKADFAKSMDLGLDLRCINDSILSSMASCIQTVSCSTFADDSKKCIEDATGESSDVMPGGQ
ncbi:MAG: hypothetical protein QM820_18845 [Minicystis sp.]